MKTLATTLTIGFMLLILVTCLFGINHTLENETLITRIVCMVIGFIWIGGCEGAVIFHLFIKKEVLLSPLPAVDDSYIQMAESN